MTNNNQQAFLELVRAGLWEKEARLSRFKDIDYSQLLRLAEAQAVVGLVAAGIEHVVDTIVPKEEVLQFVGQTIQLEQRNVALNAFIAGLNERLRAADIYTILVKGQGIAQCYERPLWRASGDVDLLLSSDNYEKAKALLLPLSSYSHNEEKYGKHIGLTIASWEVELHGTQRCELSRRMDKVIDDVQEDIFFGGNVRSWMNGKTTVFLPSPNNDIIIIFTHFIKHFFKEGVGLRQICDWCRLLWKYRESLNIGLLETKIKKAGLMTEWKAFAAIAVEYLGLPVDAMPLYCKNNRWSRKAQLICDNILEVGNMGHNRDMSYFGKYPYVVRKLISFVRRSGYLLNHTKVFPYDSIRFFPCFVFHGLNSAVRGE